MAVVSRVVSVRTDAVIERVTHVRRRERKGSSSPVVADTTGGVRFVKLHGASQGAAPLVAEFIVGALGDALGLSVPTRHLVELPHAVPSDDQNDELRDLLDASVGTNLAFEWLEGARDLSASEFTTANLVVASRVLWLDMLVQNLDRTPRNANLMMRRGTIWLIDHGACLPFQHDWSAVTESHPARPYDVAG
ncbi:MAG TPA: HipA family kinase, partial [Gemmatimonas sp.]|uniref:HipA family kinase n=1 Tax=Gemmatimonas sp. TaxID=1962908 RepID=UPI002ED884E6